MPKAQLQTNADPDPDLGLLEEAAGHYHTALKGSGVALQQMKWRGSVGGELVEHFRLGFADGTLKERLTSRAKEDDAKKRELIRVGLIRSNGQERFAGTLVMPVFDASGRIVQLRGGAYHVFTARVTPERFIPRGVEAVFHRRGFTLSEELIVAPSGVDALRFWFAGHVNVTTAAKGLTLSDGQLELMKEAGTKRVLFAFDAHALGDRCALEAAKRLSDAGIHAYRVPLVRRFMPTSQKWGQMIREAQPMLGAPPRPAPPPIDIDWKRTRPGARP